MIDREKRDQAAALIRRFLDGSITSEKLDTSWPSSRTDRALDEVGSVVWLFYDDFKPRRMIGAQAASADEALLLHRYAAFLDSGLPYAWPRLDYRPWPAPDWLVRYSFGLLEPVIRRIRARNARLDAAVAAHGDVSVWPFTKYADCPESLWPAEDG